MVSLEKAYDRARWKPSRPREKQIPCKYIDEIKDVNGTVTSVKTIGGPASSFSVTILYLTNKSFLVMVEPTTHVYKGSMVYTVCKRYYFTP